MPLLAGASNGSRTRVVERLRQMFISGDGLERAFDTAIARVPGIGSVYTSFNEMSKMLRSSDTQSFQEVKLVEFPSEGSYTVAFVTAESPSELTEATGHENMTTLFMPMAPNPVMGGFVIHVSEERVHDVDLTVEEGVRSIVTSGVATGESDTPDQDGELVDLARLREQACAGVSDLETLSQRTAGDIRQLSREDLAAFTSGTCEDFGVVWAGDDDGGNQPVHYMLNRSEDDDLGNIAPDNDDSGGAANPSSTRDADADEPEHASEDDEGGDEA